MISFILASAALHALCFYLFQIIYPPTVALLPPPARVNVITAGSEDGRLLLRWIEAEDPALSSTTVRPPDAPALPLPETTHVPSYANHQPALREPPPLQPDLRIPSAQPPGPVPTPHNVTPAPLPPVATAIHFGDEAAQLGPPAFPALKFSAATSEPPQPAHFRVAIDALGIVRYCFLETSSGAAGLDRQARTYLAQTRFASTKQAEPNPAAPLLWTTATVEWGNDIATPASIPASAP